MALEGAEQRRRHDTLPRDSLAISKRHMRAPQPDRRPAPRRSSPARTKMSIATSLAANRGICGRKLRSVRGEEAPFKAPFRSKLIVKILETPGKEICASDWGAAITAHLPVERTNRPRSGRRRTSPTLGHQAKHCASPHRAARTLTDPGKY